MSHALAPRPAAPVDVLGGDDLPALEAALTVRKLARSKGLPDPIGTELVGGRVVVRLLWPHLLLWADMLDGLGQVPDPDGYAHGYSEGQRRMQVLPNFRERDFSVHGWTNGDGRRQQWVLRPVHESDCTRCADLPEPRREARTVEAWFHQQWWDLTGRRWVQPTRRQLPSPSLRTAVQA